MISDRLKIQPVGQLDTTESIYILLQWKYNIHRSNVGKRLLL